MVKKCLLIVLMLLCMSACTSKEEKQELNREEQQGKANALLYMKDKYGIQPTIKSIRLGYVDTSPIPSFKRKTDGTAQVEMMYQGRTFTVKVFTDEKNQDGSDDYQIPELQEAYRQRLAALLKLDTDLYIYTMDFSFVDEDGWYEADNMIPKEKLYEEGKLDAFLTNVQVRAQLYTIKEKKLKTLKEHPQLKNIDFILLNFKSEQGAKHYLQAENISYSNRLDTIYTDIQKQFAADLKDSVLHTKGEFYHTNDTPRYIGDIRYYSFNRNGVDTGDSINLRKEKVNPADFQDMKKNYKIHAFSEALTIEKKADYTVLYMPQEDFITKIKPTQKDSHVVLWQSFINRRGERVASEFFDTSSTKITDYRDEEGNLYKKIVPAETSITLCYAEVSAKKAEQ